MYYNLVTPPSSSQTTGSGGSSLTTGSGGSSLTNGSGGSSLTTGAGGNKSFYLQNPLSDKFNTVGGIVNGFMEILSYLAVLFAVLMLVWVGLQFILAQGKPERMNELKKWLYYIVIGVAIVIGARIIVQTVINTLQATGTVSTGVINNANNALKGN
ncbi:MAG: TrbC/VirB2 family protein [Patescibacteria group bacterium]|nr:TrbC/VirB2 family protein [Patescibacteria group bacterium]